MIVHSKAFKWFIKITTYEFPGESCQRVPHNHWCVTKPFLNNWKINGGIAIKTELWYNKIFKVFSASFSNNSLPSVF